MPGSPFCCFGKQAFPIAVLQDDIPEVMSQVQEATGIPDLQYVIEGIPDEEWVDKIKVSNPLH